MRTDHLAPEIARVTGEPVSTMTGIGGGDICRAYRVRMVSGRDLFVKTLDDAPGGFFESEAGALRRLGAAPDGVPVPQVLIADHRYLALEWVEPGAASPAAAERFGRQLAATHGSVGDVFGSRWGDGWIGTLRLPGGPWPDWPQMWAHGRIQPFLRAARDRDAIDGRDTADIERLIEHLPELASVPEPPSLVHGDLWAGNVLWAADGTARLIDPATHGGHRETDLAMLTLFGLPHLDRVIATYDETWPLADGWRERIPLHQLHPILVHAVLFGGSYGSHAGELAREVLRGSR